MTASDIQPAFPVTAAVVTAAAQHAAARIAPLWPLRNFVAVNPFLGLAGQRFEDAAKTMARVAGARMTMPRGFYLDAVKAGRVTKADLDAALSESSNTAGLPRDAGALIEAAGRSGALRVRVLPTIADIASDLTGKEWAGFVTDGLSTFAADHFDEGQASWASPSQGEGLFAAWRQAALIDRTPEIMGLPGFRLTVSRLPDAADAMLVEATARLGLNPASLDGYFHRLLMSVGGWAAYVRYKVWQSDLYGKSDDSLVQFLAVRLAWEAALFEIFGEHPGFTRAWRDAHGTVPDAGGGEPAIDCLLQSAFEIAWRRQLVAKFESGTAPLPQERKAVQAAFCIDVRSEVFRRALESVASGVETIGFAGFFGFPIEYVPLGHAHGGAQCPVLLTPKFTVREAVRGAGAEEEAELLDMRLIRRRFANAWKSFKLAAVSSFAFVETMGLTYLGKLATDGLGLSRTVPHPASDGIDGPVQKRLMPRIDAAMLGDRMTGFTDTTRIEMAEAVLTAMSMTKGFARIVLLAGHGSTTVNNPHASGLDCGACGGHTGEANARVAAAILNDPLARAGLGERGIAVPEDTVFLGALHDTTTDEVRIFDREAIPASHAHDLAALTGWLDRAGRLARSERAALLHLEAGRPVDPQILARSGDWAQVRPEWGLAGCAAFIAAPRARTTGLDLGGRAFLHSYDWRRDKDFRTLELIMTAPMVVASWISLQYYGSTVDNRVFGSGDKVLHNVVGTIGVLEGNGGDLRTGLSWQSVHDGERLVHQPLRLSVVIEAPREAMNGIIARHAMVRDLVDNGWLHLFALDEAGRIVKRYAGNLGWEQVEKRILSEAA